MMYRMYWPIAVKLPAYVSNEKLEKGTEILPNIMSQLEIHELWIPN